MEDPIITIADIRATGHCVRGAGRWFALHGLDFKKFMREGLPASTLLATDDALARQVVEHKMRQEPTDG